MIDKLTSLMTKPYFVPCSEFVKKSYQQYFGMDERRTQVIYNSVNAVSLSAPANAAENLRQEFALPANAFIYLNVGRLDPQKNHKVLLKAFQKVSEEIPNAFLLLAGVGFLDGELKKLAEDLQIKGKTLFLGRRNDIGALLELADAFVFPSFFEGLPVALVEAMFKALPCISSRIEVFKEVVTDGETGLLINPESVDELKDAMIKLYKDEDLRNSLGANAFEQAQTKFNAAVTARQWEDFYSKVKSAS
jgi:glycosyltransferase involved in cell wall biosynthesis